MERSRKRAGATLLAVGLMMVPLGCGDDDGTDVTISVIDPADEYVGTDLVFVATGDAVDDGLICPVGDARVVTSLSETPEGEIEWEFICSDGSGQFVILQSGPGVYGSKGLEILDHLEGEDPGDPEIGVTVDTGETWEILSGTERHESLSGQGTSTWIVGPFVPWAGVDLVTTFVGTVDSA